MTTKVCTGCGEEKLCNGAGVCTDCDAVARAAAVVAKIRVPTTAEVEALEAKRAKMRAKQNAYDATPEGKARIARKNAKRVRRKPPEEAAAGRKLAIERAKATTAKKRAERLAAKAAAAEQRAAERELNKQIEAQEAVSRELAQRELARRKLIHFVKRYNPRYKAGWVHIDMCERLDRFFQDIVDGKSPRLMFFIPPRHGKSKVGSEEGPAFFLGNHPEREIISSSYSQPLTMDFSHKVQERVNGPDFQVLFPNCKLKKGRESLEVWRTDKGGGYVAAGVGGPLTGRGADCLLGDTVVETPEGLITIEELLCSPTSRQVLSWNEEERCVEFRCVEAIARRQAAGFYRITTAAGRVVEATGNHPFYVDGSWVKAAELTTGDRLLCSVSRADREAKLRGDEGAETRPPGLLLWVGMQYGAPCGEESTCVQGLRGSGGEEDAGVVPGLYASWQALSEAAGAACLSAMQRFLPAYQPSYAALFPRVCQSGALGANEWYGQSYVAGRYDATTGTATWSASLPQDEAEDSRAGWPSLRRVLQFAGFACPSHGSVSDEQCGVESGDAVRRMPQEAACEYDTVAVVERVREATPVYDLQVEGAHCFFADGALVHNCLIIDDPFKNRQDADSAINREMVWNWYTSTAYTRLMPGGGILVIQTRWHEDDLSGRLIAEYEKACKQEQETGVWPADADRWEIVSYPAIAMEDEKYRRKGEALHPERYTAAALHRIRRTIGPRDWSALYQQQPTPDEGEYFQKENFRYYGSNPARNEMTVFAAADLAISKEQHADYSVFVVGGIDANDDLWILDVRRDRWDAMQIIDQIFDIQTVWGPQVFGIEEGVITKSLGPFLNKRIREEKMYKLNVHKLSISMRDKVMRARPIQGRMKQGKVKLPENAAWLPDFVHELLRFPNGAHDDQVDALAWLGQMMDDVSFRAPKKPKVPSWKDKLNSIGKRFTSNSAMAA